MIAIGHLLGAHTAHIWTGAEGTLPQTLTFVGVRDYRDPNLARVEFAVDDAIDLASLFAFELGLIEPSNIHLALSGDPIKESSVSALARLIKENAKRSDASLYELYRLVYSVGMKTEGPGIYVVSFAGHGFNDQGSSLFCPQDTLHRRFLHTGLNLAAARDDIDAAKAERRLVLVDACRVQVTANRNMGDNDDGLPANEEFLKAFANVHGLATLFATSRGGYSYDDADKKNGVFTSLIVEGLRGGAAEEGEPYITLRKLSEFVQGRLLAWIQENRQQHIGKSRGVHLSCESFDMENLPLAVNTAALESSNLFRKRIEVAVDKLRAELKPPITGELFDRVRAWLELSKPGEASEDLLKSIEMLDGTGSRRKIVATFVRSHFAKLEETEFRPEPPIGGDTEERSGKGLSSPRSMPPGVGDVETKIRRAPASSTRSINSSGMQPRWAADCGQDEFGEWAEIQVEGMTQRLRWIPPGKFLMGSPETERGRLGNEGPQHEVDISEGFWLADTPCVQQLWSVVMRRAVGRFRSPRRPVEGVSWNDVQAFLSRLSSRFPECEFSLPTEEQWEFACRAGCSKATYAGDITVVGLNHAPELDAIAWYGGNSGRNFELSNGETVSEWPEMQYAADRAGTRVVGEKLPNSWGLFDMLGNVWEWCQDEWRESYNFSGNTGDGLLRVIRGGSWASNANVVRAASRNWRISAAKGFDLGFRIAVLGDESNG